MVSLLGTNMLAKGQRKANFATRLTFGLVCLLLLQPWLQMSAFAVSSGSPALNSPIEDTTPKATQTAASVMPGFSAASHQTAHLLGIDDDIASLQADHGLSSRTNSLRSKVVRRLMHGILQVQIAENRLESEMAYTYDVLSREQRKVATVNQFFNVLNFMQFSVLYTVEPYSRIHKQFKQSAICTCIGAGLGITIPVVGILYNKYYRAKHLAPPAFLTHVMNGKPVDASDMPPLVVQYLDQPSAGAIKTRRETLAAIWKERYQADLAKRETLAGIDDGKSKPLGVLNNRIVLLWSLYTVVQGLNKDLLQLISELNTATISDIKSQADIAVGANPSLPGLSYKGREAARLLRLEGLVGRLKAMDASHDSAIEKTGLRLALMQACLAGFLDLQVAADRCQEELNYQYDVVLAQMMARRGKFLQRTYEFNFIQSGTLGACAGWSYLHGYGKAGNEIFLVANSVGTAITTISLLAMHGGWRKNTTAPNSLADFFELRVNGQSQFSPLVHDFLDCPEPDKGKGQSRRQYLFDVWSGRAVTTMNLDDRKDLEKLGSMSSCKWDTIKLVTNRIALLTSLQEEFGQFTEDLHDLFKYAWPEGPIETIDAGGTAVSMQGQAQAQLAHDSIRLLGLAAVFEGLRNGTAVEANKLLAMRNIFASFLTTTCDGNLLAHQILVESQVLNKMIRQRDQIVQLTNIVNFYQIGILGAISNCLGLSNSAGNVLASNRINIVSGIMIGCFALATVAEKRGGLRPDGKPQVNPLGGVFNRPSEGIPLSPVLVAYLDSKSPFGSEMTRRQELIKYWTEARILNVDVKKPSVVSRLSAEEKSRQWWSETITLISNRVTMLYDLRATLRTFNSTLDASLACLD